MDHDTEKEILFPYQLAGAKWLTEKNHALLADEMGLGKSAQAIRAADMIGAKRVLVLCPAAARYNWEREFKKFSTVPRTFTLVMNKKIKIWDDAVICSYDLAGEIPKTSTFDVIICDEAHYLKSIDTNRTKIVFGKEGLVHRAKRCWALSGTPAPNHPGELWPVLFTFGATRLAYSTFADKFCVGYVYKNRKQITGARVSAIPDLKKILDPIMLRRKKDEVLKDLPPISYQDVLVEPGLVDLEIESSFIQWIFPRDRRPELLDKLKREEVLLKTAFGDEAVGKNKNMLAMEALAQSVSTLRRYNGLQKVEPVADMVIEELTNNAYSKIVLFAIHRDVIEGLRRRLFKFKAVTLYGGTDPETRQNNIDKFQKVDQCRVFIGNITAAGTAITLTAAHQVLFVEQDWVPGNNAQAAMRCHRIGQTKPVTVRFAGIANSIDEKITIALRRKTSELTKIFDKERSVIVSSAQNSLPAREQS